MFIIVIILIVFFAVLIIFSFPQFSPIPYFPSNIKDIKLILKALNLKNDQTIVDLGAGGGLVIFEAAKQTYKKQLNTQFIAVELNPILILILYLKRLFNKNRKNIKIIYGDLFKLNYKKLINELTSSRVNELIFYLYVSPWFLPKIISRIKKSLEKFSVVSYFYEIENKECTKKLSGKNNIYLYKF